MLVHKYFILNLISKIIYYMKQYSNVKRQYIKGIDAKTAQYSKSFKNSAQ